MKESRGATHPVEVRRQQEGPSRVDDQVAVEEPMEIRLEFGPLEARLQKSVSITMRTPGEDFELARGFLFSEGILTRAEEIQQVERCGPPAPGREESNVVRVCLRPEVEVDLSLLQRNFLSSSACGVCGKASLEAVATPELLRPLSEGPRLTADAVQGWPERLRSEQANFRITGGVHAAGVIDRDDAIVCVREDVGRHNAVDKVVGALLDRGELPVGDQSLMVSGRTSFEILQKAIRAGFPVVASVGAPSSLAVELALRFEVTLIGFVSAEGFNVYAGGQRVE